MKLALITCGLFLLSYVAVNRGLGPQPALLFVPLVVVFATTMAARWLMWRRGRRDRSASNVFAAKMGLESDRPPLPAPPLQSRPPVPPSAPRGGKARKLF